VDARIDESHSHGMDTKITRKSVRTRRDSFVVKDHKMSPIHKGNVGPPKSSVKHIHFLVRDPLERLEEASQGWWHEYQALGHVFEKLDLVDWKEKASSTDSSDDSDAPEWMQGPRRTL
jgi:hypothetical protein